ncbi:MAG: T9SS type A sorting domain-containing protein, partial [Candidatus Bipolaricaulaceae bacterium]
LEPVSVPVDELPPAPPEPKALLEGLKFANVPNPVTDVHTTKFVVLGPMSALVEAIRVKVFDLSGRLVWEGVASGAELTWHTDDLTGKYLANGVYLYRIEVKVLGEWVASGVLKLVINR